VPRCVVTGAAAGLATTTDWEGRYALNGVAGDSVLRVSKAGYVDKELRLDDNDHFDIGSNLDVVEALGGARVLFVLGDITAAIAANRLTGTLNGRLQLADRAVPSNGFFWGVSCGSSRHQVEFSR
jgi:hypothetical protein